MITRQPGSAGPRVSTIGLGCMGMSDLYGPANRTESIATIHAALDAGITLLDTGDFRGFGPRFSGENLDHNLSLVEALHAIAEAKGITVAQIAIAWVLSCGQDIVPLVGARRRERLTEALGALNFTLTANDLAQIERAVPAAAAAGDRYDAAQMAQLDSERS
jgi:aryl-alcohol dehydrogenase-like predicted oxidoreductase